jgi:glycosyltransferase involved in cell wall biosynthesis
LNLRKTLSILKCAYPGLVMRILAITPFLPYPQAVNAGPLVMHDHLALLAARHTVTLATFADPDTDALEALQVLRQSGINVHAIWHPQHHGMQQWIRRFRMASTWCRTSYPLRNLWFRDQRMQHLLDHLLSSESFDLIHVEDNAMGSYHCAIQLPMVLTEHEVRAPIDFQQSLRQTGWLYRILNGAAEQRRWQRYQPSVWRRFNRIQVFTSHDAESIKILAPDLTDRVRVNPFGIHLPAELHPDREAANTVVFSGGFLHPPNVDAALWLGNEIMPRLRALCSRVRLLIVGSHPPREVQELHGEDIIVTGRVPAIDPFLEQAAVVLTPLRIGGGMRLKVLQAMSLGKAIVTTAVGARGLGNTADQAPLFIAADADEIAHATAALLDNPRLRRALGQRAHAFVAKHYSWKAYQDRLEAIYAEVCAPSHANH